MPFESGLYLFMTNDSSDLWAWNRCKESHFLHVNPIALTIVIDLGPVVQSPIKLILG